MSLTTDANSNPIKVTGTTATSESISTRNTFIKFVYWYQPTTKGHLLSLKDTVGNIITKGYCEAANESQYLPVYGSFKGISCDDLDSGSLYIYIR